MAIKDNEEIDIDTFDNDEDVTKPQVLKMCINTLLFMKQAQKEHSQARSEPFEEPDIRFNPKWLRASRIRFDLPAREFAEMLGVSARTVYNWENGITRPSEKQRAAIAIVRKLGGQRK